MKTIKVFRVNIPKCIPNKANIYYLNVGKSFWKLITKTDKTIKLERIKNISNESIECDLEKITCKFDNRCKHCIRDWGDNTYTIYPNRSGEPYYFRPAKEEDMQRQIKDCKKWGVSSDFYENLLREVS